jgi:hypothetical protein
MERGYFFLVVTAPVGTEEITFQSFEATSEEGGKQLCANLKSWRERHGIPLLRTGFTTQEDFGGGDLDQESGGESAGPVPGL